ncbi:small ribosomal subunit protein mS22 [Centruroides vittatus]|uniref:small ribosomal subunit protein mS22 n=1 Tax=Centruroides vittatus TaxID=120091 RepID=UPI003510173B
MEFCLKSALGFRFLLFRRRVYQTWKERFKANLCSAVQSSEDAKEQQNIDIEQLFLDQRVQSILEKVTGLDMAKVFRPRKCPLSTPRYQFLTDKQLQDLMDDAKKRAKEKLQMPPVMKERKPITNVISYDPEIQGYADCKYVFTDITYGISDRKRIIVTRHPDGKLCHSSWEERHWMNQIYFPVPERTLEMPKMFEEEHLQKVLDRQEYEFVLDRACLQCDPDDPIYIRVTQTTYLHIDKMRKYDDLRSTRHFGPMVFYFAVNKQIDNLLLFLIQKNRLEDAVEIIKLYYIIHPRLEKFPEDDDINYIQNYIEFDAKKRNNLQLALQTYVELYHHVLKDKNAM